MFASCIQNRRNLNLFLMESRRVNCWFFGICLWMLMTTADASVIQVSTMQVPGSSTSSIKDGAVPQVQATLLPKGQQESSTAEVANQQTFLHAVPNKTAEDQYNEQNKSPASFPANRYGNLTLYDLIYKLTYQHAKDPSPSTSSTPNISRTADRNNNTIMNEAERRALDMQIGQLRNTLSTYQFLDSNSNLKSASNSSSPQNPSSTASKSSSPQNASYISFGDKEDINRAYEQAMANFKGQLAIQHGNSP